MEQQEALSSEETLIVSQTLDHCVHTISLLLTPHSKMHKILVINRVLYYLLKTTPIPASPLGMIQEAITLTTPPNDLRDTEKTEMIMRNFALENESSTEELLVNILKGLTFDDLMVEITKLLVALFTCVNGINLGNFDNYVTVLRTIVEQKLDSKASGETFSKQEKGTKASVEKHIEITEESIEHQNFIMAHNSDGNIRSVALDELEHEDLCGVINTLCNTLCNALTKQDVDLRKEVLNQLNLRLSRTHVDNPSTEIN